MKRLTSLSLTACLTLALTGCTSLLPVMPAAPAVTPGTQPTAAPAATAVPVAAPTERVVFTSRRNGNDEIYSMNLDGSGLMRLTEHPASDHSPTQSPDRRRIAFVSNRVDGIANIYLLDSDGANLFRLTNEPLGADSPAFAVDGESLFYVAARVTGRVLMRYSFQQQTHTMLFTSPAEIDNPAPSPDGKRIAFSARDGAETGRDIFLANLDRTGAMINLTNRPGRDDAPSWAPDGSRLAFHSDRDGDFDIFIMADDGTAQTPISASPADETTPSWSSDGRTILFVADDDIVRSDDAGSVPVPIAVTTAAEAEPHLAPAPRSSAGDQLLITSGTGNRVLQLAALADAARRQLSDLQFSDALTGSWSPDGSRLVFSADRGGNYDLYVMNADGSDLLRLTDHPARDLHPAWSPDGSTIAFESNRNGNWDIFLVPAAGGAPVALVSGTGDEGNPSWSPDGRTLVFAANDSGNFDLFLVAFDGRTPRRQLTDHPAQDVYPHWSPAGDLIVFRSDRSGDNELYLTDTDGNTRRLTFHSADDTTPSFSPDGLEIAFASRRQTAAGSSGERDDFDIYVITVTTLEIRSAVSGPGDQRYPAWRPR